MTEADRLEQRRHSILDLVRLPGFARLLAVRWPSQAGDGLFQIGAASLLLFTLDPTDATSASEVARIIAITTLPFSLAGPFAGVVIDRWRRQRILVWTNVVRVLAVAVALPLADAAGWGQAVFFVAVLAALSVNRFFLATLGAVLPKVVPGDALVPANALSSVGGSIVVLGAAAAGGVAANAIGEDTGGPEAVVVAALAFFLTSSVVATRLPVRALGPDLDAAPPPLRSELRRAIAELVDGVRKIRSTRRAWAPIALMAIMRLLTAVSSIAALLVFRNLYSAGPDAIGYVLALFGIGAFIGAVAVTVAERRFGLRPETALRASLAISGIALVVFAPGLQRWALYTANVFLGIAFSAAKIPADALVQSALPDRYRGRVFAAYDVLYNLGTVVGGVVTALTVRTTEAAEPVLIGCGLTSLLMIVVARPWLARMPAAVDVESWEEAERLLEADS